MMDQLTLIMAVDKGRRNILWLIKLRKASAKKKMEMMLAKGEENYQSIIRAGWLLSDVELQQQANLFAETIDFLTEEINIQEIL